MIRSFCSDDTDALLDTWYAASLLAHPFLDEAFLTEERRRIREIYIPATETWVYEEEGALVGFISLLDNEVGAIFVRPEHHGRGIGRALMDKAVALRGNLLVEVFEQNPIGRAFYDRYGFQLVDAHPHDETGHMLLRLKYEQR